jgi:hypothetical protein
MQRTIYVKLLDEGTIAYRPVAAIEVESDIFEITGFDIYTPEDEVLEFSTGARVLVEEKNLSGENVLVAITDMGPGGGLN